MKDNIQKLLIEIIKKALADSGADTAFCDGLYLDFPADNKFGDLSTNIALRISKQLKKPPFEIAGTIVASIKKYLQSTPVGDCVQDVKVEGAGFINFYLSDKYFYGQIRDILKRKTKALNINIGKGKKALIEFVSANPTGPLSVAHARQAAVGDALANILNFCGFKAKKEYYLNDEGNQINILGNSVQLRIKELDGEKIEFPDNYYQGDYIYEIAKKARDMKLETQSLGDYAASYILDIIKKELSDFGVGFDIWYSQKALGKSGKIKKALDCLKTKGFVYEQDGAVWFKSTQFGDDKDRVVIKSDGLYTYLAPDIAYHQEKYRRGFAWLINLWGPDHHGYINRLRSSVQAFGKNADSLSVIIVQLATIFRDGKPVQMSTRRGQYITLREVLDEVGRDASRFFFLMRKTSSHLDFDLSIAKKTTSENPVYYVQYAYARISSILRNATLKPAGADLSLLKEREEIDLIKKLLQFCSCLDICVKTQDPYMLTVYLQETAEGFHKFYDKHRVLGVNENLVKARLGLLEASKIVISTGLKLLGVSLPDRM